MKAVAVTLILVAGIMAQAQIKPYVGTTKTANPSYKEHYTVGGAKATEPEAFMGAIQGKEVYRCVLQEASMGKSGKSAALKNVKKNQ